MNIVTSHDPKPIPMRGADWTAIDEDTYDGAPDSYTRNQVGTGSTKDEAIDSLLEILSNAGNDVATGMLWWNRLNEAERRLWLNEAEEGVARGTVCASPADAWAEFKVQYADGAAAF